MIAWLAAIASLVLLVGSTPSGATVQSVLDITPGQTLTGKAGKKTDLYRFVGGSGTTIEASLVASGKSALILYTPDGEEMLSEQGTGLLKLSAILPLDNVFFLAVLNGSGSRAYTLRLKAEPADRHLELMAHKAGYAVETRDKTGVYQVSSCWIEPGLKIRRIWPKGTEEISLGRGGKEFGTWKLKDGRSGAAEREVRFEGANVIYERTDGSMPAESRTLEAAFRTTTLRAYQSYLCPPE